MSLLSTRNLYLPADILERISMELIWSSEWKSSAKALYAPSILIIVKYDTNDITRLFSTIQHYPHRRPPRRNKQAAPKQHFFVAQSPSRSNKGVEIKDASMSGRIKRTHNPIG